MKCYIHAKEGSAADAIAVCVVCGMGLCMDHAVEQDLPVRTDPGVVGYPERGMLILCPRDAKARGGGG